MDWCSGSWLGIRDWHVPPSGQTLIMR